jgi:Protein of unknown function (DUF3168)
MTDSILNAEKIVGAYLRQQPAIEELKASVLGATPDSTANPWIRVTLIDVDNYSGTRRVEYLMGYYLQLDCYAGATGGQAEAWALATAARSALVAAPNADIVGALVTDVEFRTMPRSPDPELQPTRDRYIIDLMVTMRPKP